MIASISGIVQKIKGDSLVVQVGGVGLLVILPKTMLGQVDEVGRPITLFTHLQWREKGIALYGFSNESELELFELLLSVSGVGPRLALAIISTLSPDVLTGAVAREEPEVLQRVSGIGKKTAQRIMFHLRDRFQVDELSVTMGRLTDVDAEVIAALTALGYSVVEAQTAIQRFAPDSSAELEDRIRLALGILGG